MAFSDIPTRGNTFTDRSWWNDLRDAGRLLEGGSIPASSFVIANNQLASANVTSMLLSSAAFTSAIVHGEIKRGSLVQIVEIYLYFDGTNWNLEFSGNAGSDAGVIFTVTAGGQVQYTSSNTSAGVLKWAFQRKVAV